MFYLYPCAKGKNKQYENHHVKTLSHDQKPHVVCFIASVICALVTDKDRAPKSP